MITERVSGENNFIEKNRGKVKRWSQITPHLPEDVNPRVLKFIRGYYNAQLLLADGKRVKARRKFEGLVKKVGFKDFEKENQQLFAAIDIVVRGSTNKKLFKKEAEFNIVDVKF